jgi:hypothetical protein
LLERVETVQRLRKKKTARETEEPLDGTYSADPEVRAEGGKGRALGLIWIRGPLRGYGHRYKAHPLSFRRGGGDLLGSIATSLRLAKRGVYLENPIPQ